MGLVVCQACRYVMRIASDSFKNSFVWTEAISAGIMKDSNFSRSIPAAGLYA